MTKPSGTATYNYDNCGRLTSVSGLYTRSFTWDYEDRMTSGTVYGTTATNYTYNGVGTRTAKSGPYGSRTYKRDGVGVTAPVLSDGIATMVPGISEKTTSGTSTVHTDRLGSMKAMSSSGSVTDTAEYDAFGNVLSGTGSSLTQKGFAASYGYQEDGESGLKLLGHRYYDPETGRFISRDPARSGGNWYCYCDNNPVALVDPNGQVAFLLLAGVIAVVAVLGLCDVAEAPTGHEPPNSTTQHRRKLAEGKTNVIQSIIAIIELLDGLPIGGGKPTVDIEPPPQGRPKSPGKRGGPEHVSEVAQAEAAAPSDWEHISGGSKPEKGIRGPDGKLRFPDLEFRGPNDQRILVQVGEGTKTGVIKAREREAIDDLTQSLRDGDVIYYIPYYKPGAPRPPML